MKVKMLKIARGPSFAADPGEVVEVPDDLGRALVVAGAAEEEAHTPAPFPEVIETTAIETPVETAVSPDHARPHGLHKGGRRK